jgi:hypothetical protein
VPDTRTVGTRGGGEIEYTTSPQSTARCMTCNEHGAYQIYLVGGHWRFTHTVRLCADCWRVLRALEIAK